ncbi:hypothetical protein T05_14355 [Trichinella murrelli]|uniref:Uncharacterized protein n=1 Tax=Trichinella murrelli TaxID=144512 RepID=A0A0V0UA02_9BILA|nr:hypothetical protein T05_14355 [Trichinella murrelli]
MSTGWLVMVMMVVVVVVEEESGLMLDRNLHNAVEWVFVAWRKGKKNCHRVQYLFEYQSPDDDLENTVVVVFYSSIPIFKFTVIFSNVKKRIVMFSSLAPRRSDQRGYIEKKTKERHVGTKGIYYIFH